MEGEEEKVVEEEEIEEIDEGFEEDMMEKEEVEMKEEGVLE